MMFFRCNSAIVFPKMIKHPAGHPWLRNDIEVKTPFDISILKFVKHYIYASNLRKSALRVRFVL